MQHNAFQKLINKCADVGEKPVKWRMNRAGLLEFRRLAFMKDGNVFMGCKLEEGAEMDNGEVQIVCESGAAWGLKNIWR